MRNTGDYAEVIFANGTRGMNAFGDALKRLMAARGIGVRELSRMSHYTSGHISNLRTGKKRPSTDCAAELDELLGAGGELAAITGEDQNAPGDSTWEFPHRALAPAAAAAQADDVDPAQHLLHLRQVLADSDNLFGPVRIIPVIREHITMIQQLRYGRTGQDSRELLCIQARYAESLAWLCQDSADFRAAQYWLDRSLEWAHMAADEQWAAYTLARKSQLAGDMHDPASAVDLAEAAARLAGDGTRLRAAGAAYQAHGHALAGDPDACLRILDEAHEIAAAPDEEPGAPWGPWLSTGYVEIQRARCLTALGDHQQAAELFGSAIAGIPASLRRDRGVYIAREALAHAAARDPGRAAASGMRALAIVQLTHSGRILTELRRLDAALRRWKNLPEASGFLDAFASIKPPEMRAPRRSTR